MLDGKTGQLQFHIEKKPITLKSYNKYGGIIRAFKELPADQAIKVPCDSMNKTQIQGLCQGMRQSLVKIYGAKDGCSGTAVQNGFIYLFKRVP